MDFGALLHYAKKKNDAATTSDEQRKFYSTKYAPPKKESKESKQLSNNIQKFLKKREAEEAERKREERQKLNDLMAKRDEKSKNKIRKMLKVTKSANKSVLEDAKDCDNLECAPDGGGDGDDYGYVSNEANAFYQKYIEKVKDVQEDKGFAPSRPQSLRDLSGTKERVKAAITREREEAKSHTRQRVSGASSTTSSTSSSKSKDSGVARAYSTSKTLYDPEAERREEERKKREEEQQRKSKMKRPAQPPPMDFQALLRLAEKKQHEPVVFAQPEKKKEPERLLSAREKRELEERQKQKELRAQRDRQRESELKSGKEQPASKNGTGHPPQRMEPNGRIPKLSSVTAATTPKLPPNPEKNGIKAKPTNDPNFKRPSPVVAASAATATSTSSSKLSSAQSTKPNPSSRAATVQPKQSTSIAKTSSSSAAKEAPSRNPYAKTVGNTTREFPPRDRSSTTRQFPPSDVRGRGNSNSGRKPPPETSNKRRIYDDDDSEYDSELDDFIDDGDCEEDISSHIRDIFGYDKRRYRGMDDDDRTMESSFAQMQREEFISKKLGLQEDLEDMRMEAMHKKRKIAKKHTKRLDDDDDD